MKKLFFGVAALALATLIVANTGDRGMALKSKRVLFSKVEGVVQKGGVPIEGAEVVQKVLYKTKDTVPEVRVLTDEHGRFALDEVSAMEWTEFLPGETLEQGYTSPAKTPDWVTATKIEPDE